MSDPQKPELVIKSHGDAAAALPYLFDLYPAESIILIGLSHPQGGRIGQRISVPLPADTEAWEWTARESARALVEEHRAALRPIAAVLIFILSEPKGTQTGWEVTQRLTPLARALKHEVQLHRLTVVELLSVSEGRWWSYLCRFSPDCFGPQGTPVIERPSAAAAARAAGLTPAADPSEIAAALSPVTGCTADTMRTALDDAADSAVKLLRGHPDNGTGDSWHPYEIDAVRALAAGMDSFRNGATDLDPETAAAIILGVQVRSIEEQATRWTAPEDLPHARHLWQYLAVRCVDPYQRYASRPLTLFAITAMCAGDPAPARFAIRRAEELDPTLDPRLSLTALTHLALNEGVDAARLWSDLRRTIPEPPC